MLLVVEKYSLRKERLDNKSLATNNKYVYDKLGSKPFV